MLALYIVAELYRWRLAAEEKHNMQRVSKLSRHIIKMWPSTIKMDSMILNLKGFALLKKLQRNLGQPAPSLMVLIINLPTS